MIEVIEIIKPGLATSVQDLGRYGMQKYGIVAAGAMDSFALQVSNILVGNPRNEACLEIAWIGPKIRFLDTAVLAICGAKLSPKLDGTPVPLWKSFIVHKDQILEFGSPEEGMYAYLAIHGGIDVPIIMGSKATYVKAQLGGFLGRILKKGDCLPIGKVTEQLAKINGRSLHYDFIPTYAEERSIKVLLGPDDTAFTEESIASFLNETYEVTNQVDRMGYRLKGPKLIQREHADIFSDAILPGTIQVPASGDPIILLADRQTTGGYTRIATVISTDLPYLAQKNPGESLTFEAVTLEKAQRLYRQQSLFLQRLSMV